MPEYIEIVHDHHGLRTVGQEYVCQVCRRRWDFDEKPDDDEKCIEEKIKK